MADWAALGSAAFAAVAAGASWATVLQTRRERIAAATPSMSIDVITPLGTTEVRVQIMNHGAAVRGVEFAVAVDGQMTFSVTPRPTLGPGETLLLRTAINHFSDAEPVSYVSCYDLAGRVLHAWWPDGEHRVYGVKDRPEERVNRAELMAESRPRSTFTKCSWFDSRRFASDRDAAAMGARIYAESVPFDRFHARAPRTA